MGFKEELKVIGQEMVALWQDKKFQELADKFYAEDSTCIYPQVGKVEGRSALAKCWRDMEKKIPAEQVIPSPKWEIESASQITDEIGIERMHFNIEGSDCWVFFVWKKIGGKWQVKQEYFVGKTSNIR